MALDRRIALAFLGVGLVIVLMTAFVSGSPETTDGNRARLSPAPVTVTVQDEEHGDSDADQTTEESGTADGSGSNVSTEGRSHTANEEVVGSAEPDVTVYVDLDAVRALQAQVEAGHTPGKRDPWQVALGFLTYETRTWQSGWKAKVVENTGTTAIVSIDQGEIERIYLARLVRKDELGVWSVVGYDLR